MNVSVKVMNKSRGFLLAAIVVSIVLIQSICAAEPGEMFTTSSDCAFCHTSSSTALKDSQGNDLSIYHDWSSSMMANAFRDPIFRAKLESERLRTPHLAEVIEDKCLTCHAPMARYQHLRDGGKRYALQEAETSSLAADGVSCTLCHQVQPEGLGTETSFSGHYNIGSKREIYGPYKDVFENPMLHHVGYRPCYGAQVHESSLCGTCHTLFTPYVDNEGTVAGEFPEQTPYLEWLNSRYGSADDGRSCQECHMPRIDEPVKITNRPPWLKNTHSPFWKHHFTGGNVLVLEMLRKHPELTGIDASDEDIELTIQRTLQRLSEEAAALSLETETNEQGQLQIMVTVKNRTGHKFPSGFPVRRAWLQLQVRDQSGIVLFDSGSWNKAGEIKGIDDGFEPHHDTITDADQVQVYQAVMGDVDSKPTYTLLRAAGYLKDNRLVPDGYSNDGPMAQFTRITGKARLDNNFNKVNGNEGSGTDRVTYNLSVDKGNYPLEITARFLYQTAPPRFISDLLSDQTSATSRLAGMYDSVSKEPVVIDTVTVNKQ